MKNISIDNNEIRNIGIWDISKNPILYISNISLLGSTGEINGNQAGTKCLLIKMLMLNVGRHTEALGVSVLYMNCLIM